MFVYELIGYRNRESASFLESDPGRLSLDWFQLSEEEPLTGNLDVKAVAWLCSWQDHSLFVIGYNCHSGILLLPKAFFKFQVSDGHNRKRLEISKVALMTAAAPARAGAYLWKHRKGH